MNLLGQHLRQSGISKKTASMVSMLSNLNIFGNLSWDKRRQGIEYNIEMFNMLKNYEQQEPELEALYASWERQSRISQDDRFRKLMAALNSMLGVCKRGTEDQKHELYRAIDIIIPLLRQRLLPNWSPSLLQTGTPSTPSGSPDGSPIEYPFVK